VSTGDFAVAGRESVNDGGTACHRQTFDIHPATLFRNSTRIVGENKAGIGCPPPFLVSFTLIKTPSLASTFHSLIFKSFCLILCVVQKAMFVRRIP